LEEQPSPTKTTTTTTTTTTTNKEEEEEIVVVAAYTAIPLAPPLAEADTSYLRKMGLMEQN
jgi:hypothetical protein